MSQGEPGLFRHHFGTREEEVIEGAAFGMPHQAADAIDRIWRQQTGILEIGQPCPIDGRVQKMKHGQFPWDFRVGQKNPRRAMAQPAGPSIWAWPLERKQRVSE